MKKTGNLPTKISLKEAIETKDYPLEVVVILELQPHPKKQSGKAKKSGRSYQLIVCQNGRELHTKTFAMGNGFPLEAMVQSISASKDKVVKRKANEIERALKSLKTQLLETEKERS